MNLMWRLALRIAYRVALCYWFIFRPTTRGVYVAVWCGRRVLLIRNSYKQGETFPAGGVKRTECPESAALRELSEEVGLQLGPSDITLVRQYLSRDEFKSDCSAVYEAALPREPKLRIDQREVIHAEFVDSGQVRHRLLAPIVQQYMAGKGLL